MLLILILRLVLWNSKPKSIFQHIWVEKVEFSTFPGSLCTEYFKDVIVRIHRKVWKQRQKWLIVLSVCYSHIFIVTKSKNWRNLQKINGITVAIKIFFIKQILLQPNFETRLRLYINLYHNWPYHVHNY